MKKLLLLTLLMVTLPAFAQGTIKFNNRLAGQVDAPVSRQNGQGFGSLPGAMAQLYLIPAGGYDAVPLAPATTFRTSSPEAMFYVSEPNESVVVPGAAAGSTVTVQLRVWAGGSSWETATLLRGESESIQVTLGGVPPIGAPIPDAVLVGLDGFMIPDVPEPSTFALGVLGAAALLYRRRE